MTFRHFMSWKPLFYEGFLPALRMLGAARCAAVLEFLGRVSAALWPPRRAELTAALVRVRTVLNADWNPSAIRPALAANALRFLARDCPLSGAADHDVLGRFDVAGYPALHEALAAGRGAILVGSHLGGHIAGMHWLARSRVPIRLLVQRPRHVSKELNRWFDRDDPHPQSGFFLLRDLARSAAIERLLRARAALRDGLAIYVSGDIPWQGPNARGGRLLGQSRTFVSVWADLARMTRAPVFAVFCTHRPGGRFALTIDPISVADGENAAVAHYLARLEAEIAAHPADAVAHLLWPCYGPPCSTKAPVTRPGHRVAAAIQP